MYGVILTVATVKSSTEVTFKNVTISGHGNFTPDFTQEIESAKTLKEVLPIDKIFDEIKITHCYIPVLYKNSISDIDSSDLILTYDEITVIQPGTFKNVPLLRTLVISRNKIDEIQEGVFNNLNISTLDLTNNRIRSIAAGAFNDMPKLFKISLTSNLLAVWNKGWFAHTPLLSKVFMAFNLLEEIPSQAFQNFKDDERLGSVSRTLDIDLSYNKIKKIEKTAFNQLSKIGTLSLENNQIADWNPELLSNVAVEELRLDYNKLECLSGDLVKIFTAKTSYIHGNPWDCECLNNIHLWATRNGVNVTMYFSKMRCEIQSLNRRVLELTKRIKEEKKKNIDFY